MKLYLSNSSSKILNLLFQSNKPLYINEIIRGTSLYPNSVQRSLKSLSKQNIIKFEKQGNKKFYIINKAYRFLTEIKSITKGATSKHFKWIKWVNREFSVAVNHSVGFAQSRRKYIKRFRFSPINYFWYNSVTGGMYESREQMENIGREIAKEIKRDQKFAKSLAKQCIPDGENLIDETRLIASKNLGKLPLNRLYSLLDKLHKLFLNFAPYFVVPVAIENAVKSELNLLITNSQVQNKLLEPVEVLSDGQIDELNLASKVKKSGWDKKNMKELKNLTQKYCWLPMMALFHKPFDEIYFKNSIETLINNLADPKSELQKLKKEEKERRENFEKTLSSINANKGLRDLVSTTQSYISLRTYRVNVLKQFNYHQLPLLKEIAERIEFKNEDMAYLTYEEILEAMENSDKIKDFKKLIRIRKQGFANLTYQGKTRVISGVKNIIQAIEQFNIYPETPIYQKIVSGNTACKGKAKGQVKVVRRLSELSKVKKGDILVAKMTTPDYMSAIKNAAAIITNEGGITCHAAIVSRELNIPAIIGTKNATQILSDEDVVEVNADKGLAKVIESSDLPENIKEITGKTIYKGRIRGKARIILDTSDFEKLRNEDIVIAPQTTPDYLSLLYRASGFVVDEESLTSHAVLYGKALKMPSIMGTNFARNAIKDGDKVELNATEGILRKLEADE